MWCQHAAKPEVVWAQHQNEEPVHIPLKRLLRWASAGVDLVDTSVQLATTEAARRRVAHDLAPAVRLRTTIRWAGPYLIVRLDGYRVLDIPIALLLGDPAPRQYDYMFEVVTAELAAGRPTG